MNSNRLYLQADPFSDKSNELSASWRRDIEEFDHDPESVAVIAPQKRA
jgi:hypothetical protein